MAALAPSMFEGGASVMDPQFPVTYAERDSIPASIAIPATVTKFMLKAAPDAPDFFQKGYELYGRTTAAVAGVPSRDYWIRLQSFPPRANFGVNYTHFFSNGFTLQARSSTRSTSSAAIAGTLTGGIINIMPNLNDITFSSIDDYAKLQYQEPVGADEGITCGFISNVCDFQPIATTNGVHANGGTVAANMLQLHSSYNGTAGTGVGTWAQAAEPLGELFTWQPSLDPVNDNLVQVQGRIKLELSLAQYPALAQPDMYYTIRMDTLRATSTTDPTIVVDTTVSTIITGPKLANQTWWHSYTETLEVPDGHQLARIKIESGSVYTTLANADITMSFLDWSPGSTNSQSIIIGRNLEGQELSVFGHWTGTVVPSARTRLDFPRMEAVKLKFSKVDFATLMDYLWHNTRMIYPSGATKMYQSLEYLNHAASNEQISNASGFMDFMRKAGKFALKGVKQLWGNRHAIGNVVSMIPDPRAQVVGEFLSNSTNDEGKYVSHATDKDPVPDNWEERVAEDEPAKLQRSDSSWEAELTQLMEDSDDCCTSCINTSRSLVHQIEEALELLRKHKPESLVQFVSHASGMEPDVEAEIDAFFGGRLDAEEELAQTLSNPEALVEEEDSDGEIITRFDISNVFGIVPSALASVGKSVRFSQDFVAPTDALWMSEDETDQLVRKGHYRGGDVVADYYESQDKEIPWTPPCVWNVAPVAISPKDDPDRKSPNFILLLACMHDDLGSGVINIFSKPVSQGGVKARPTVSTMSASRLEFEKVGGVHLDVRLRESMGELLELHQAAQKATDLYIPFRFDTLIGIAMQPGSSLREPRPSYGVIAGKSCSLAGFAALWGIACPAAVTGEFSGGQILPVGDLPMKVKFAMDNKVQLYMPPTGLPDNVQISHGQGVLRNPALPPPLTVVVSSMSDLVTGARGVKQTTTSELEFQAQLAQNKLTQNASNENYALYDESDSRKAVVDAALLRADEAFQEALSAFGLTLNGSLSGASNDDLVEYIADQIAEVPGMGGMLNVGGGNPEERMAHRAAKIYLRELRANRTLGGVLESNPDAFRAVSFKVAGMMPKQKKKKKSASVSQNKADRKAQLLDKAKKNLTKVNFDAFY